MTPAQFLAERLKLSAIPPTAAAFAGIRAMTVQQARAKGHELHKKSSDGFLIPYYSAEGKPLKMFRWRNPRGKPKYKYTQPKGTGCWVYFPRVKGLNWKKILADPEILVYIVEGELKALSVCLAGVPAVALGGVWNYSLNKELLPELRRLAEGGRPIYIAFDSDAEDKPGVAAARHWLMRTLLDQRGQPAIVRIPHLPDPASPDKTGADDLVRITKLKDAKLLDYLDDLTAKDPFALAMYERNSKYVVDENTAEIIKLSDRNAYSYSSFCNVLEPYAVPALTKKGEPTQASAGHVWLGWPSRNMVAGRVYKPLSQDVSDITYAHEDGKRYLNNWLGWASEPQPDPEGVAKYWTRLLDHLFQAQHNESTREKEHRERCRRWFEMWWAYPVQHPGAKLHTVSVLLGHQGGGKSLVGDMVGWAVYGEHFQSISQKELESDFNAIYTANKSLVMGNEITARDYGKKRDVSEFLKAVITDPNILVNEKKEKKYKIQNLINLYLTSNYGDSFFLDDDDRRYFIWDIPDVKLRTAFGNADVDELVDYAQSEKGKAALHYHLLHLTIDPRIFQPHSAPPETEAKRNAKEYSQTEAQRWVGEFAADQESKTGKSEERVWLAKEELYKKFRSEPNTENYSFPTFQKALRTKCTYLGRSAVTMKILVQEHGRGLRVVEKKIKPGFWVLKHHKINGRFPTLADGVSMWKAQQDERIKNDPFFAAAQNKS